MATKRRANERASNTAIAAVMAKRPTSGGGGVSSTPSNGVDIVDGDSVSGADGGGGGGHHDDAVVSSAVARREAQCALLMPRWNTNANGQQKDVQQMAEERRRIIENMIAAKHKVMEQLYHDDYLSQLMFADLTNEHDPHHRCTRYWHLLTIVENMVIARYEPLLPPADIRLLRLYMAPSNWNVGRWGDAVASARKRARETATAPEAAVEKLIDEWMRAPRTTPAVPSNHKKDCEEFMWFVLATQVPCVLHYMLSKPPNGPRVLDSDGLRHFLVTGDVPSPEDRARQARSRSHYAYLGRVTRFYSMTHCIYRAFDGTPIDAVRHLPLVVQSTANNGGGGGGGGPTEPLGTTFGRPPPPDAHIGAFPPPEYVQPAQRPLLDNVCATVCAVVQYARANYWRVTRTLLSDVRERTERLRRQYDEEYMQWGMAGSAPAAGDTTAVVVPNTMISGRTSAAPRVHPLRT